LLPLGIGDVADHGEELLELGVAVPAEGIGLVAAEDDEAPAQVAGGGGQIPDLLGR
jgi:hypothetical protein